MACRLCPPAVQVHDEAADRAGFRVPVQRAGQRRQPARFDLGVVVEQVQQPATGVRAAEVRAAREPERDVARTTTAPSTASASRSAMPGSEALRTMTTS